MRRVVVTGVGLVTPLGLDTEATWTGLLEGRTAVGPIAGFDASSLRTRLGAEATGFDGGAFVPVRRMRRTMTRSDEFALAGATLAIRDAALEVTEEQAERAGLFVGGNKEVSDLTDLLEAALDAHGPGGVDVQRFGAQSRSTVRPLFFVEGLQSASLFYISQTHGLKGTNTYFAGGAEAGAVAVGRAFRAVRRGEADVVVAGGFDDAVSWWNMSKIDALGMLSPSNEREGGAVRPYDRERDGTVLGEGAAFVVLEEAGAARRRGARVYAEVTGFGSGFDATHAVTPDPDGTAVAGSIERALEESAWAPHEVDYVAAHGSGTRLGDVSEARALRRVFGDGAGRVSASSVKPATGHLVAGAGALNAAVAALAVARRAVPPTLNLERLDAECLGADWVTGSAREQRIERALAVARGVEGQTVALALQAA
jgi:3-oxoacyl-[acyl-carrier-protein] synthase II